ncbi:MAG: SusE domain-containing protein [Arachidicoccus sp.]|nr:SusE domain-containing protein [Arachidicoccus sp.]
MKKNNQLILIIFFLLVLITGCQKSDMVYKDAKVSAVDQLYAPLNNVQLTLSSTAGAVTLFQWSSAHAQDDQVVSYEVVFYKESDTTTPIYRVASDDVGKDLYANISHSDINSACAAAGIAAGDTGTIYWSVVSWRGLNSAVCSQKNKLIVTRLEGFAVIPSNVYLTGAASENGDDISKAILMQTTASGKFEIYTKLNAGSGYNFVDRTSGTPVSYYINASGKLAEADNGETTNVTDAGIYRITLDFNNTGVTITKINSMGLFFCNSNAVILDMTYQGLGVWSGKTVINLPTVSYGLEERYKFQMETSDGTEQLGAANDTDSPPTSSSPDSYYYVKLLSSVSQWDNKWKFDHALNGVSTTITISLKGGTTYTHTVKAN